MPPSSTSPSTTLSTPASGLAKVERCVVAPEQLDPSAKRALIDELYATHSQIFTGVSKAAFANYVVNSPAERTRIEVYRVDGRVVGYFAIHVFVRMVDGQQWVVLRAEKGKLPSYRQDSKAGLMMQEILRICLRYPGANKALLGCFVHPSAYLALNHVAPQLYPRPDAPTPAPIAKVMAELADEFELEQLDTPSEHDRRHVGWITKDGEAERRSWGARSDAATRFFLAANPGYSAGEGLVVLAPFSIPSLIEGSLRHFVRAGRRRLARARVRARVQAGGFDASRVA